MIKTLLSLCLACAAAFPLAAQDAVVNSPDGNLQVAVTVSGGGLPAYSVSYRGKTMLETSPLGLRTNIGDFTSSMTLTGQASKSIDKTYEQDRIKTSKVRYQANELTCTFANADKKPLRVTFRVSNNDVAFRYEMPKYGETASIVIEEEATGFDFPASTTTFLTPQSDAMIGWKRTKPSYEEEYKADAPMSERSCYGHGYTFPCLFRIGNQGWVLISETGVDSKYCASHLSDTSSEGLYTIAFPLAEENNGNGTVSPGLALPGVTPWRTITVGDCLKPIVETTVAWDVVEPLYETKHDYRMGRGTWSWILWQDGSINFDDQKKYVDLAASLGYEYVLIDNWWDTNIGRERMKDLIDYAHSKHVDVFLWYSSSGYWNDIVQGPTNYMDNPIIRKREMKWLHSLGVKGIKVDFFGGDKQETMRLYEAILSDADDHGLMVIFHGCTLPRGWERMYPNYVGSEAVLASENLIFQQHFCDTEAFNACLHPFIRNTVGCMEFGGVFLNKRLNRNNDGGSTRRTTDVFQLATGILFQNPIQNFALAPNNLTDAPQVCIDFMKQIPTTWDETRFIDGYPGKYVVLARRHGEQWYVAGINAHPESLRLKLQLPMLAGRKVKLYSDDKQRTPRLSETVVKKNGEVEITLQPEGGIVFQDYISKEDVKDIIYRVNDQWQASHPKHGRAFWDNAAYHTGNMEAYLLTGEERYRKYSEAWAEHNQWMGAKSADKSQWKLTYGETDEYVLFGDYQICFQTYADLYNLSPDPAKIARAREVMEYQMSTPRNDYWWWVDGLYMVMPVMTKLYRITSNPLYLDKLYEYYTYANSIMYDPDEKLYYRDAKYIYPKHKSTNGRKDFWARGDGWVFAALAKVLQDLPADDAHRDEYLTRFCDLAKAIAACQQPEGYWTRSMLDPQHAPGPETSGTAFFTCGLLWGINHGYLNTDTYLPVALKAWNYLTTVALQPDGRVGYVQPIGERAIPGQVVDRNSTSNFGVGAFLLAACEMYRYLDRPTDYPGWKMVWSDEFNRGFKPDPNCWGYEMGFERNEEYQWYQPDNAYCRGGMLVLEGRHEQVKNPNYKADSKSWRENRPYAEYTASSIKTRGKKEFLYGRFEVRARIPVGGGAWPAIWTLGSKMPWPSCGEIDIMEYYRIQGVPHILANAAWGTDRPHLAEWNSAKIPFEHFLTHDPDWASKFHIWRMDWDEEAIRLYLDDELLNEIKLADTVNGQIGKGSNPFRQPHYLLLNLAIGGINGGEPDVNAFPMKYEIDYVRVYNKVNP